MNDVKLKGQWKQLAGKVQEKWGQLTHNDGKLAAGRRKYLEGKIQERHGMAIEEAARQVREFNRKKVNSEL